MSIWVLLQGRKLHNRESESCLSCTWHAYWSSSSPPNIKLSQIVWELWPAQGFGFKGDNYITKIVELSLLHATGLLVLLFIPTKYYQNMPKGAHKDVSMDRRMDGCHADHYIPRTYRSGDKNAITFSHYETFTKMILWLWQWTISNKLWSMVST